MDINTFWFVILGGLLAAYGLFGWSGDASVKAPKAPSEPYTSSVETCRNRRTLSFRADTAPRSWLARTLSSPASGARQEEP